MIKKLVICLLIVGLYSTNVRAQEELLSRRPVGMKYITVTPSVPTSSEGKTTTKQPASMSDDSFKKKKTNIAPKQAIYDKDSEFTKLGIRYESITSGQTKPEDPLEETVNTEQTADTDTDIEDKTNTEDFTALQQKDTAIAEEAIDSLRVRLKDGRIVQLVSIDVPDMDSYDPGEISRQARDMLSAMVKGKQVRLYQTKNAKLGRVNRMGHTLGHLVLSNSGAWLQGALLSAGLAQVRPTTRNPEMAARMIELENKARAAKIGLWKDDTYKIYTPDTAAQGLNNWAVVEGKVKKSSMAKNKLYLNFGDNWRDDFTIMITPTVRKKMIAQGQDPLNLQGATLRVRGWLEDYNGPNIELIHPAWLEVLSERKKLYTVKAQ